MLKKIKIYRKEVISYIEAYADEHHNGNFTAAVNTLLGLAIKQLKKEADNG